MCEQASNFLEADIGPSCYIVDKKDRTVYPDLERAMAKCMGATVYELDGSQVPMLSQPERVLDVIRAGCKSSSGSHGSSVKSASETLEPVS